MVVLDRLFFSFELSSYRGLFEQIWLYSQSTTENSEKLPILSIQPIKKGTFSLTKRSLIQIIFVVWYEIGCVLKGHICPASQVASHMQVNPTIHEGSLLMSRITIGNSWGKWGNDALFKNYAFACHLDCYLDWVFVLLVCWFGKMLFGVSDFVRVNTD